MWNWYLLYLWVLFQKNVCIDRAIGEPIHGKYLVDIINACDKQHLKRYIKQNNQPHEETRTERSSLTWLIKTNWYWLLLDVEDIIWRDDNFDQKVGSNTKKGGTEKIIQINYNAKEVDDKTVHLNLTYQLTSPILPKINNMIHSGLHGHYRIHCDPFLGVGCKADIRITFWCESFIETIKSEWV